MLNQGKIDRVIEVLIEQYGYKISCNQVGRYLLEVTVMDTDHESIAVVELRVPINFYQVNYKLGYHQLHKRDKRKLDELLLDFSDNPVLPHLTNWVKMPRPTVFKCWEHYLDSCQLIDRSKYIYLGSNGYYQVDQYGYVKFLKTAKSS